MSIIKDNDLNTTDWRPIKQSDADSLLGAVPPIYFQGGFACGETYSHDSDGVPLYICIVQGMARICSVDVAIKYGESQTSMSV